MSKAVKRKRQRNNKKNPLADARGSQKTPSHLWFKRSGAGYRLFVEYYSQQPPGVIVPIGDVDDNDDDDKNPGVTTTSTVLPASPAKQRHPPLPAKGMSRAAKKRRKKKGTQGGENHHTDYYSTEEATLASNRIRHMPQHNHNDMTSTALASASAASPLLQAVASYQPGLSPNQRIFFQAMARPLPTTFRIRNIKQDHEKMQEQFDEELEAFQTNNEVLIQPIPFGNQMIYQCSLPKYKLPPKMKTWLVDYSQKGIVARQELGSMLPVLALPLSNAKCVLDMCASPGSKTLQALEECWSGTIKSAGSTKTKSATTVIILANDILESRLIALKDAVDRSGLPRPMTQCIQYSQVDATQLTLSHPCDAVICDVPCSGDGTCRKDPHIIPMWKPSSGNALHSTQLAILKRSLELVKAGGYVCYSTCSLNPVEDEAVVAATLKNFGTTIELVELDQLNQRRPHWIHRPGVHSWKVANYEDEDYNNEKGNQNNADVDNDNEEDEEEHPRLTWYDTYASAMAAGRMKGAVETMWPPPSTNESQSAERLPLERCARLLPQDYDSGGFFLALFRKKCG